MSAFEIDFIAVGDGERSGDALAARYLTPTGSPEVIVFDGGTKKSGEKLVEHIQKYSQTYTVGNVVNSHPDMDHSSGLSVVVENLTVKRR